MTLDKIKGRLTDESNLAQRKSDIKFEMFKLRSKRLKQENKDRIMEYLQAELDKIDVKTMDEYTREELVEEVIKMFM